MSEPLNPTYAGAFRCLGPECEDHCCGEWNIPLDRQTYAHYQTFPADRLGKTVQDFVFRNAPDAPAGMYANIYREPSGRCPFFGGDKLCQIQQNYGPLALSASCSIYPRSLSLVGGELEGSLSMSCPEAARQVLLDPGFLNVAADLRGGGFRTDNIFYPARDGPSFDPIRRLLIAIVRDRTSPLAQRLLLIGSFVQELDRVTDEAALATLIARFRLHLGEEGLDADRAATSERPFSKVPSTPAPGLRLELVLTLTNECLTDPDISPRFRDTFWTFIEGIGSPAGSAHGKDVNRFLAAKDCIYRPFMAELPCLMENYVINYMFQHLFPFGRTGSTQFETRSCAAEWVLMTLQFAWMEGLLIGVAAQRREHFGVEDVVRTVQTFTRATEHDPTVLEGALEHVAKRGLNNLEGMAALLGG